MTLIVIGLLLGVLGLLWVAVIGLIRGDHPIDWRNHRDGHGPFADRLPDDTKAA